MAVLSRTVVAATFDIVVGRHWRNDDESALAQLLRVAQDNLGASVVVLDRTFDFNHSAFELLNVVRDGAAVVVQTYLALTPSQIHVWARDESAPPGTALVELPPIALPTSADPTTQMHTIAVSAAGADTLRIAELPLSEIQSGRAFMN